MAERESESSLAQENTGFWAAPHRVLFPAAYLCAVYVVFWWPLGEAIGIPPPAMRPPVLWHLHELLFGFGGAALGGYLLTALPSWTGGGRLLSGAPLKLLFGCWLLSRLSAAGTGGLPAWGLLLPGCAYFLFLGFMLLPPVLKARAHSKLPLALSPLLLGALQASLLLAVSSGEVWSGLEAGRLALWGFLGLIILVGGRAVPAFTRNALALTGHRAKVAESRGAQALALVLWGLLLLSMIGPQAQVQHGLQLALALVLLWSMRGWHSFWAARSMLLFSLHLAYLWLPIALLLQGGGGLLAHYDLYPMPRRQDLLHGASIGAMSLMIMAISGRAAAHRPGGEMRARLGFILGFALVWLSATLRLVVGIVPDHGAALISLSAGAWCLGWLCFGIGFLPALRGPLQRPVLSGKRHKSQNPLS